MFDSIGWGEILVLLVAGLFILGPERLPAAAAWAGRAIRQVRDYASGAREQIRQELGPEFDELRKPLNDLRGLRGSLGSFDPRRAVTGALFDDGTPAVKPNGFSPTQAAGPPAAGSPAGVAGAAGGAAVAPRPLAPGERPPIDDDAT